MTETSSEVKVHRKPNYLGVFWVLAALTGLELGVTYLPIPRLPVLIPLALAKAALVAMYYMHLKFDRRIFSVIFGMGLLMGIGLILSLTVIFGPRLLDVK